MKKGILFILGMFMMVSTAEATNGIKSNGKPGYYSFYKAKPIEFVEKGIKFYVLPNGDIDFTTRTRTVRSRQHAIRYGRRYLRRNGRSRVPIVRDYYGRVKRVGNVYLKYNRLGKISRIGSVFVNYRHRRITSIGGMQVKYNRYGDVRYSGYVKPRFSNNGYWYNRYHDGMVLEYDDDAFYNDYFYEDFESYDEDDYFYYYKSKKGKSKGAKKATVLKRKKIDKDLVKVRKKRH